MAKAWVALKAEHATPTRLGVGVGVGVFVGCSPAHGFQVLICLGLAALLRLNKLAVMLGLQVSAPPLTPLVIFAGLQTGEWVRFRRFLPLSPTQIRAAVGPHLARSLIIDFVLGSLIVGAVLGTLAGVVTTALVRRRRARLAPGAPAA